VFGDRKDETETEKERELMEKIKCRVCDEEFEDLSNYNEHDCLETVINDDAIYDLLKAISILLQIPLKLVIKNTKYENYEEKENS
jgi:hypothetical protein